MKTISSRIALAFASALVFTGCSAAGAPGDTSGASGSAAIGAAAGWKDEFEDASRRAHTDFEKNALADGRISDAEFSEMENGFSACLRRHNVTFDGFGVGGGYGFTPVNGTTTEEANSIADDWADSIGRRNTS